MQEENPWNLLYGTLIVIGFFASLAGLLWWAHRSAKRTARETAAGVPVGDIPSWRRDLTTVFADVTLDEMKAKFGSRTGFRLVYGGMLWMLALFIAGASGSTDPDGTMTGPLASLFLPFFLTWACGILYLIYRQHKAFGIAGSYALGWTAKGWRFQGWLYLSPPSGEGGLAWVAYVSTLSVPAAFTFMASFSSN